ncbi:MAG TPA: cytochrome b/b6 domain-containing protein [Vicinamibacterales bacterium]
MATLRLFAPDPPCEAVPNADEVLRFHACERHLHWALAIPFTICYQTALILVLVYNAHPGLPLRQVVSLIHRTSGVCLAFLPLLVVLWHRREFRIHLQNIHGAWRWTLADLKWLVLMGPAAISRRVSLPHQGKFNAAEKINFMFLMATYPVYIVTGFTIWFLKPAFVSWLVHFTIAAGATPLVFGHIFMATVNADTRAGLKGMITGFVDRQWARHHYRLWYDEVHGSSSDTVAADAALPALVPPVTAAEPEPIRHQAPAADRGRAAGPGQTANPSFAA